jgi:hypothetical protein
MRRELQMDRRFEPVKDRIGSRDLCSVDARQRHRKVGKER